MKRDNVVSPLLNSLKNKKLSSLEIEGLTNDLSLIEKRLNRDEYKKGFYTRSKFDVYARTRDIYTEIEFYTQIGKTWEKIFSQFPLDQFHQIVDLCPGFTPKVELGLYYAHFKGTLLSIDIDKESLATMERFMSLFNPSFSISKKAADIFRVKLGPYPFVVANHVIDDLVMYYFAREIKISIAAIYKDEERMLDLWKYILKDKEKNIKTIVPLLTTMFTNVVEKNGYLIITHYKSYVEKLFNLDEVSQFNKTVFGKTVKNLTNDFSNEHTIVKASLQGNKGHFNSKECYVLKKR